MPSDPHPENQSLHFDTDLVKHIAYLVRLGITEDEAAAFGQQFETIIEYFKLLNEADRSVAARQHPAGRREPAFHAAPRFPGQRARTR